MLARVLVLFAATASCLQLPSTPKAAEAVGRRAALSKLALLPLVLPLAANAEFSKIEVNRIQLGRDDVKTAKAATTAGRKAAKLVLSGKYSDPMHPGCERKLLQSGKFLTITGADEDGKKFTVKGLVDGNSITIDFTPKGGPAGVVATADVLGITFP